MYRYKIYGLVLESEIEFEEFLRIDENSSIKTDVYVRSGIVGPEITAFLDKIGKPSRNHYISMDYSFFRNDYAYFLIKNGNEIIIQEVGPKATWTNTSHFAGFAMSMLMIQRRMLPIHCSIVTDGNYATMISGSSGAGKSTVTRKLLDRGFKLMADDIGAVKMVVDKAIAYPAFPYQKMCRDEVLKRNLDINSMLYIGGVRDKFLVPAVDVFVDEPKELKSMFVLAKSDIQELEERKLSGFEHLLAFKASNFLVRNMGLWMDDAEYEKEYLKVAGKCPAYQIVRPEHGDLADKIADYIIKNKGYQ